MKSIIAITLLVALVSVDAKFPNKPPAPAPTSAPPTPTENPISDKKTKPVGPELKDPIPVIVFEGIRGAWQGLQHGIFKTKDSGDQCLNDDVSAKIDNVLIALSAMDVNKLSLMVGDIMSIVGNLQKCNVNAFVDLEKFCQANPTNCSPAQLTTNAQKNMFVLIGKITDLSQVLQENHPKTAHDVYNLTYKIADDLGNLMRVLLNFDEKAKRLALKH